MFLDNLSVHKSKKVIKFYVENNINVIFNSPYQSNFNSIELAFRALKNNLYKKIYSSMEEVEPDIKKILDSESFQKTIKYNYKETLSEYLRYFEGHRSINLEDLKLIKFF